MNQTSSEPILLKFLGGAGSVTGSMYLVRAASHTFLLECGLFQGPRQQAHQINSTFPFMPKDMEFLLLSHAHIDHSGNIPTLVKQGFRGKIYSTSATADLASVMLVDSAHIQIEDVEYLNRKLGLWGEAALKPLYAPEDVQAALPSFVSLPYQEERKVDPYLSFTFFDAGHILGSSIILLEVLRGNERIRICFTGDLGRKHLPILRDPYQVRNIAYLIVESTYGSSLHDPMEEVGRRLAEIINRAVAEKGKVIIPAFAIERAQEVLYEIFRLEEEKQIPEIPIFVDSPLTAEVTEIFQRHPECYDEELRQLLASDKDPFHFRRLRLYPLHRGIQEPESHAGIFPYYIRLGHVRIGTHPSSSDPRPSRSSQYHPFRRVSGRGDLGPTNHRRREEGKDIRGRIPGPGAHRHAAQFFCPCRQAGSIELCGGMREGNQGDLPRPRGAGSGTGTGPGIG